MSRRPSLRAAAHVTGAPLLRRAKARRRAARRRSVAELTKAVESLEAAVGENRVLNRRLEDQVDQLERMLS